MYFELGFKFSNATTGSVTQKVFSGSSTGAPAALPHVWHGAPSTYPPHMLVLFMMDCDDSSWRRRTRSCGGWLGRQTRFALHSLEA